MTTTPDTDPDPAVPAVLPDGWTVSVVEVTETTVFRVPVTHPVTATPAEIAAAGYRDYATELDPTVVFAHDPGADQITVAGRPQPAGDTAPEWAANNRAGEHQNC